MVFGIAFWPARQSKNRISEHRFDGVELGIDSERKRREAVTLDQKESDRVRCPSPEEKKRRESMNGGQSPC